MYTIRYYDHKFKRPLINIKISNFYNMFRKKFLVKDLIKKTIKIKILIKIKIKSEAMRTFIINIV